MAAPGGVMNCEDFSMFQVKRANLSMVRIKICRIIKRIFPVMMFTGKMYKCLTLWSDARSRVVQ